MILADEHGNKDLWETPDHIYNILDIAHGFTLDPCCTIETAKCRTYYTPLENGLIQDWAGYSVFVNPPYSRGNIDKWVEKCFNESAGANVVALLPVSTSSNWFQRYVLGNTIEWVDKRIKFKGAKYTAPFSSMIVTFNKEDRNIRFYQKMLDHFTDK